MWIKTNEKWINISKFISVQITRDGAMWRFVGKIIEAGTRTDFPISKGFESEKEAQKAMDGFMEKVAKPININVDATPMRTIGRKKSE